MDGSRPFHPEGSGILQIPISLFRTIAQLQREVGSATGAAEHLVELVDARRDYCCLYDHPDGMGDSELEILEEVLKHVRQTGIPTVTHFQVYQAHHEE